ncbi:choline/ethanolamine kinase, partial [Thraustotheca clavata]
MAPNTIPTSDVMSIAMRVNIPDTFEHEHDELRREIAKALGCVVSGWENVSLDDIAVQHLSGAMTNVIFACEKSTKHNQKVLLRIYGTGTDAFFERSEEMHVFQQLSRFNLGVGLLGEFENGRVETMIDGTTCTAADIRDPIISEKIAKKFRQFHDVQVDIDSQPRILKNINRLLIEAQSKCVSAPFEVNFTQFNEDVKTLTQVLSMVPSPIVFCHND